MVDIIDWILENMFFFWLIIAVFFLILEMGSPGLFFFLSFFFGAISCAIATFFTTSLVVQSIIFIVGTFLSFIILQFLVKKNLFKGSKHDVTNVYALRGKKGRVLKCIEPEGVGLVKVLGQVWSARIHDNEPAIKKGALVIVLDIKGAHLVVRETEEVVDKSKSSC